jgi:hypothetical protein
MERQAGKKKAAAAAASKEQRPSPEAAKEEEEKDIAEPTILEQFAADKANFEDTKLPKWLYKYLVFRFNLLDRTGAFYISIPCCKTSKKNKSSSNSTTCYWFLGDSVIDHEEFEYVLSEFGVSERTARQAFTIFTQVRMLQTLK